MKVNLIYTSDKHSAFTDLTFYQGQWFCAFREASTHMSLDGQLVILTSADAENWQEHSRQSWQGGDLRDPKFSITPNNQLLLTTGIRWRITNNAKIRLYSVGWLFNGKTWSEPYFSDESAGKWRWGTCWHKQTAYSVSYGNLDAQGGLYSSPDGLNWQPVKKPFFPNPKIYSNESSLCFIDDQAFCVVRRDKPGGAKGLLGKSSHPFTEWNWQELATSVGAPKLLKLSNGEFVVAGRYINYQRRTAKMRIYKLNIKKAKLKLWRELPSGGDCSYPGLVEKNSQLYISYYSSHEYKNAAIYLAKIPLHTKPRSKRFA